MQDKIILKGAREHNLRNVDVEIPKNKIVVFTGVSGSGKSSLVFNTICAEAQRQIIETFSTFARRRLPKISKPAVDEIENLSTAIVIDQKRMGTTLRSTVGTATEIYTHLRMLFSRCGDPFVGWSNEFSFNNPEGMCPECQGLGKTMVIDLGKVIDFNKSVKDGAILHSNFKKGGWYWRGYMKCGFFDPEKPINDFTEEELHNFLYKDGTTFTNTHMGEEYQSSYEGVITKLKRHYLNKEDGTDAYTQFFTYKTCPVCNGSRINAKARSVKVAEKTIPELVFLEMPEFVDWLDTVKDERAEALVRKMRQSALNLINIGVGYLSLHRTVATLSGGESQRVKMSKQLDCNLVNLMYILDEPSIGLHPKDINQLKNMLTKLCDKGNTVLVVEHDLEIIRHADYIVDIGPEAGIHGGEIMYSGSLSGLLESDTITSRYLLGHNGIKDDYRIPKGEIRITNAQVNNLKNIDVSIPTGIFVCITGVAGSGKSSLIHEIFCKEFSEAIVVDQSPVGRSNRSTPLSYVGIFDTVRKIFAAETGQSASLFSFNSKGACPSCKGHGFIKVEMSFLDDVQMLCSDCQGKRYIDEVLELTYKSKNIHDVLEMTVNQGAEFFEDKSVLRKLKLLQDVGLGYLKLGQPLSSLSGGEAQRIKLASELHKKGNIYVMDEPTTGLHMADIDRLMKIIDHLVDKGNSVIVIEHNLNVIKNADWIIDLGPEGGSKGGEIVACGTPQDLCEVKNSFTGRYLNKMVF